MEAQLPPNEAERLEALRGYGILDTPREAAYDEIVELASRICKTPIAIVNLIDDGRQWFKAEVGLGVRETPLPASICAHAILQNDLFQVPDTLADPRFADNPLCTGEPHLRFYTGALLRSPDGHPLGTLCVLDYQPRQLDEQQLFALQVLANQVRTQMELRRALGDSDLMMREIDHRVKNSLALVSGVLNLQTNASDDPAVKEALGQARDRISGIAQLHKHLHDAEQHNRIEIDAFLGSVVEALAGSTPSGIAVTTDFAAMTMDAGRASSVGMITTELVTNSLKHGRGDDPERPLRIEVTLRRNGAGAVLSVIDDGVGGLPESVELDDAGLGTRLVHAMARSLNGALTTSRDGQRTTAELNFPI